jgi:16S rRNA (uracil1498-N3)-methyltransferase
MRMNEGSELLISDGAAFEYRVRIAGMDAKEICFEIIEKHGFTTEPLTRITLFQGIPKQGKIEEIIQKSVELGVSRIVPVYTQRCVPAAGSLTPKLPRLRKLALEAAKQSGRGIIPEVVKEIKLTGLVRELDRFDLVLFPYEEERGLSIRQALSQFDEACPRERSGAVEGLEIAVIIGPEGGFAQEEAALLMEYGAVSCSMGKIILRTQTAGPAAIAMTMYALELAQ